MKNELTFNYTIMTTCLVFGMIFLNEETATRYHLNAYKDVMNAGVRDRARLIQLQKQYPTIITCADKEQPENCLPNLHINAAWSKRGAGSISNKIGKNNALDAICIDYFRFPPGYLEVILQVLDQVFPRLVADHIITSKTVIYLPNIPAVHEKLKDKTYVPIDAIDNPLFKATETTDQELLGGYTNQSETRKFNKMKPFLRVQWIEQLHNPIYTRIEKPSIAIQQRFTHLDEQRMLEQFRTMKDVLSADDVDIAREYEHWTTPWKLPVEEEEAESTLPALSNPLDFDMTQSEPESDIEIEMDVDDAILDESLAESVDTDLSIEITPSPPPVRNRISRARSIMSDSSPEVIVINSESESESKSGYESEDTKDTTAYYKKTLFTDDGETRYVPIFPIRTQPIEPYREIKVPSFRTRHSQQPTTVDDYEPDTEDQDFNLSFSL
jgi:hypothetical protein